MLLPGPAHAVRGTFALALRLLLRETGREPSDLEIPLRPGTLDEVLSGRMLPGSTTQYTLAVALAPVMGVTPAFILAFATVLNEDAIAPENAEMREQARDWSDDLLTLTSAIVRPCRSVQGRLPEGVGLGNLQASGVIPKALRDFKQGLDTPEAFMRRKLRPIFEPEGGMTYPSVFNIGPLLGSDGRPILHVVGVEHEADLAGGEVPSWLKHELGYRELSEELLEKMRASLQE